MPFIIILVLSATFLTFVLGIDDRNRNIVLFGGNLLAVMMILSNTLANPTVFDFTPLPTLPALTAWFAPQTVALIIIVICARKRRTEARG